MALIALDLPPGVYKNGTNYQAQGRYYDADLWRWHEGTERPIGGWVTLSSEPMDGKARAITAWLDNANQPWTAVGTNSHLYVMTRSGDVNDITPAGYTAGAADATFGGGYGLGLYGAGLYGTPRLSDTNIIPATVWTLDTFGEILIATAGGTIYEWNLVTADPAIAVTNAPEAEAVLVTEERIIMALGSDGDPRAVDWCDAEDRNDWTPTSTNLAGGKRLQTNGRLMLGKKVRGGYLIFSDVDVHYASFIGLPLVYQFERLATSCGAASKGAVTVIDDRAYWFGVNGFWTYNGFVEQMACDVFDYVFTDINKSQLSKVSTWHNGQWSEVWWHYPSAGSIEVDRYVAYNYREKHWAVGSLDRLCGVDKGVVPNPVLVSNEGVAYRHEIGVSRDGRQPFATSGPVEIGNGDRTMEVHAVIPDESNLGDVAVSFYTGDYPMSPTSAVAAVNALDKTDVRFSARRVAVHMIADADKDFRVGRFRFDAKAGSGR